MQEGMMVDAINADIVDSEIEEWISLKSFLKLKRVKDKEKKQIKNRFSDALSQNDARISVRDDKIFLNPSRYDYSDLLRF
jgi:hypothetical protein